jgi:CheY-like chemotaxis protein
VKLSYREGSYLADRIADLELASQIEAGSLRISPVLLSMEQMIADGIQAFEPFTWDRALHFEKPENSEVPSLYGDYALLKQALRNLIGIALKLSPAETDVYVQAQENQGELSIRISNESAESGKANSEVVDLEPRDFSDESIGVFVARKILQAHGGGLSTYRSEDGQIIFQINVPLEAPAKRRGTILITEDNAQAAALLEIALEKEGYTPIRATNGLEALEIIANDSVDLVLLDVILPGMDGYEVCYRMRSSPESASIPVVIVSAKSGDEDEAKALRVGADAYLRKPLQLAQLLVAIEELLEDGSGGVGKRQIQSLSPTQPLN